VLLLPEVLRRRGGDPAGVAVAAVVLAQTAGYPVGLVGCGPRLLVAHHFSDEPLAVDPVAGVIDARGVGRDLHWRCAHESAAVILEGASERAERRGDLPAAIAAEALALALPLEDRSRTVREAAHRRLLARLN
jgi:regulator of sirC expression with transglutaminase-like and TPR domain